MFKTIFYKGSFLAIILFTISIAANSQSTKKDKDAAKRVAVENIINSHNFVFIAQYALPTGGRTMNLTSDYTFKILKDSVVADLPYFGRAFVAPINPTEGGIKLVSTSFDYKINQGKKGSYDIVISPKNDRKVRQFFLNVGASGYSSLQVISNNRQPISFNGYIKAGKI